MFAVVVSSLMDRGLAELQRALADAAVSSQTGLEKKCSRRRVQGDGLQVATVSQLAVFFCVWVPKMGTKINKKNNLHSGNQWLPSLDTS